MQDPSNTGIEVSLSRFEQEWGGLDEFQTLLLSRPDLRPDDFLDDIIYVFANAGWPVNELFTQVCDWLTDKLVNQLRQDWCNCANPNIWGTAFWQYQSVPKPFYASQELLEKSPITLSLKTLPLD